MGNDNETPTGHAASGAGERTPQAIIGVVGGVGPFAGVDLVRKIMAHTRASADADHLPVVLVSMPADIPDRSRFILQGDVPNPAYALADAIGKLAHMGADIIAMACNTAHARPILDVIRQELDRFKRPVEFVNMIDQTVAFVGEHYPTVERIGVLSTTGTYRTGVYMSAFESAGYHVVAPDEATQEQVIQPVIYDPHYGIKAQADPVTDRARQIVAEQIDMLQQTGAQAVVLGCSELALAWPHPVRGDCPVIDANVALARALVRLADAGKLKPWPDR